MVSHGEHSSVTDTLAELAKRGLPVRKVGSSNPSPVKPKTYQIDTYRYLARLSALLRWDKDLLAQCHDNGTVWDIES